MGEELFFSGLVGPYRIFRRKRGHRHGIDDATTAWYALQKTPPTKNTLDRGLGLEPSALPCFGTSVKVRS